MEQSASGSGSGCRHGWMGAFATTSRRLFAAESPGAEPSGVARAGAPADRVAGFDPRGGRGDTGLGRSAAVADDGRGIRPVRLVHAGADEAEASGDAGAAMGGASWHPDAGAAESGFGVGPGGSAGLAGRACANGGLDRSGTDPVAAGYRREGRWRTRVSLAARAGGATVRSGVSFRDQARHRAGGVAPAWVQGFAGRGIGGGSARTASAGNADAAAAAAADLGRSARACASGYGAIRRFGGAATGRCPIADTEDQDWQRLDKWLWCARVMRARSDCAGLVAQGAIRINRQPTGKPHAKLRVGDVLTIPVHGMVRVLRVTGLAVRRGPAAEARLLYMDVSDVSANPCAETDSSAYRGA